MPCLQAFEGEVRENIYEPWTPCPATQITLFLVRSKERLRGWAYALDDLDTSYLQGLAGGNGMSR